MIYEGAGNGENLGQAAVGRELFRGSDVRLQKVSRLILVHRLKTLVPIYLISETKRDQRLLNEYTKYHITPNLHASKRWGSEVGGGIVGLIRLLVPKNSS